MAEPDSRTPFISTRGLVKRFGKREVVRGVDLKVFGGEIVGLLGPNGAGKTTSFYIIVGLIPATSGSVGINDQDITRLPMYRRARMGIGYLPQEPSVFRKLSVRNNLKIIAESLPLSRSKRHERVEGLLHELGLETVSGQMAFTLSGGERRRLEIARALLTRPRFLLMDEPFSGVDPISVSEVQKIVLGLKEKVSGCSLQITMSGKPCELWTAPTCCMTARSWLRGTVRPLSATQTAADFIWARILRFNRTVFCSRVPVYGAPHATQDCREYPGHPVHRIR